MKLTWQRSATHTAGAIQWTVVLAVCLAFFGCASAPPRAAATAVAASADVDGRATPKSASAPAVADPAQKSRAYQHAEALYLSGRFKESASAFADLTRAYPRDAHVWLKYGNALTRQGSYDEAASAFQTALALDPTHGGAAMNLALARLGQAQGALEVATAHLPANSPEYLEAGALQGQIKKLLGAPGGGGAH